MICPDCKRPLKNVGEDSWLCPIALEAQRRGILGQPGRVHSRVLIYNGHDDPADQVEWLRCKMLEKDFAVAVKKNIPQAAWTSIENQADCGMFDLNGVHGHAEVWVELKCVPKNYDLTNSEKVLAVVRKTQKAWAARRIVKGGRLFLLIASGDEKLTLFAPGPLLVMIVRHDNVKPIVAGERSKQTWNKIADALFVQPNEVLFKAR